MTRSPRIAALGVALLLVPTAGCGLVDGGSSVLLLGDSLTVLVGDEVKAAASDYDIDVDAEWGVRVDEEIDRAAEAAADDPDQVVINLGTNNVLQRHDTTASAADLSSILDLFDGADCIHVVNINEHITRMGQDYSAEAKAFNEQLRVLAARRLDTHVIDWNQIVTDHSGEAIMSDDNVHPSAAGVKLLTDAYMTALNSC